MDGCYGLVIIVLLDLLWFIVDPLRWFLNYLHCRAQSVLFKNSLLYNPRCLRRPTGEPYLSYNSFLCTNVSR